MNRIEKKQLNVNDNNVDKGKSRNVIPEKYCLCRFVITKRGGWGAKKRKTKTKNGKTSKLFVKNVKYASNSD